MKADAIESALLARGLWSHSQDLRRRIAETLAARDFEPEMVDALFDHAERQSARAPDALVACWLRDGTWTQAADQIEKRRFASEQNASGRYISRHDTLREMEEQAAAFADRHGLDPELCRAVHLAGVAWQIAYHDQLDPKTVAGPKLWRHLLDGKGKLLPPDQRPSLAGLLPPQEREDAPGSTIAEPDPDDLDRRDRAAARQQAIESGRDVPAIDHSGDLTPGAKAEMTLAEKREKEREEAWARMSEAERDAYMAHQKATMQALRQAVTGSDHS